MYPIYEMRKTIFLVLLVSLWIGLPAPAGSIGAQEVNSREVFALEIPEIGNGLFTELRVEIPKTKITRLLVWVRRPFSDKVSYSKIKAAINGQSVGIIGDVRSGKYGKFLEMNLDEKKGFMLKPDRNVIEASAVDDDGKQFRVQ